MVNGSSEVMTMTAPPVPPLRLPKHFTPSHQTSGLPGFPAIDIFARGGAYVCAEYDCTVARLSGSKPTETTRPGGPYGWSIYLRTPGGMYYATHFGTRHKQVKVGAKLKKGMLLGRVADYSKATGGKTPSHIHYGFHAGPWAP